MTAGSFFCSMELQGPDRKLKSAFCSVFLNWKKDGEEMPWGRGESVPGVDACAVRNFSRQDFCSARGTAAFPILGQGTNKKPTGFIRWVCVHLVPGDRIELPTRGFSVPCSTN